jgi:hypothetical protein
MFAGNVKLRSLMYLEGFFVHLFISQYYDLVVFIHSAALSHLVLLKSHTAESGAAMTVHAEP